ncbi:MAG: CotH kinase family protein [Saprospiraceae bacterium]
MKKSLLYFLFFQTINAQMVFSQTAGNALFNSPIVHDINITFTQAHWWDSLMYYKLYADSFNLSTQSIMGNVIIDGTLVDSVGVKLKGNSSFGYPGRKKPIKIEFNEYVSGKKYDDLKTINLNNNTLDPTHMREKLVLDFLNSKGLSAPRCTYTKVSYNGQYVGLYKVVEQVDKTFLNTHYANNNGNLFKGDPSGSLGWMGKSQSAYSNFYELHNNNTVNDWSDLINLIDNINNTPAAYFKDTLESNLNTAPFIKQWAIENLFVDLDNYFNAPHNYYIYHNTLSNKFEWITWDVSVAFGFYPFKTEAQTESTSIFLSNQPLTNHMLSNPIYRTDYLNAICLYLDDFSNAVLDPKIDSIANLIYPFIAMEPDSNQMFPEQIFYNCINTFTIHTPIGDIPALKKFITNRRNNVLNQLTTFPFSCTNAINEVATPIDFSIDPNPASATLNLQLIESHKTHLNIINAYGQEILIKQIHYGKNTLDVSELCNGIYFFVVRSGNKKEIRKVLIMHSQ